MTIRAMPPRRELAIPPAPSDGIVHEEDYLPGTEDWAVLESLRSPRDSGDERDEEEERFIALMLGGDAFD